MKKRLVLLCSIVLIISAFVINVNADGAGAEAASSRAYSIQWQGLNCTGVYRGEWENGRPDGTGDFEGNLILNGEEKDKISYSGKWQEGKLHGKGVLINYDEDTVYEGKFLAGRLNGEIKKYSYSEGAEGAYTLLCYSKDVPYNIQRDYNEAGSVVDTDGYFHGISVKQIAAEAQEYNYNDLLYYPKNYSYHKIKLACKVLESVIEFEEFEEDKDGEKKEGGVLYRKTRVLDKAGNSYILKYDLEYSTRAANYIPFLEKDDELVVYGYYIGTDSYVDGSIKYPYIEAVAVNEQNGKSPGIQNVEKTYSDFLNHPYLCMGTKVNITGKVKGLLEAGEKARYFLVASNDYKSTGTKEYICRVGSKVKGRDKLFSSGKEFVIKGKLNLVKSYLKKDGNYVFCPVIEVTEAAEKTVGEES